MYPPSATRGKHVQHFSSFTGDEISELNYELTQLQEARDAEKEMYEGQLEQLKTELNDTKEQLTSENMILSKFFSSPPLSVSSSFLAFCHQVRWWLIHAVDEASR